MTSLSPQMGHVDAVLRKIVVKPGMSSTVRRAGGCKITIRSLSRDPNKVEVSIKSNLPRVLAELSLTTVVLRNSAGEDIFKLDLWVDKRREYRYWACFELRDLKEGRFGLI